MEGQKLGSYCIEQELGSGGMGTVYAAIAETALPGVEAGSRVALKVVHPHLLAAPGFFKRFLREAEIGKAVHHENVVVTYDADALLHDDGHAHFLVMEFVEGQTLSALVEELGRVPEELCRHIGRAVARGLSAIHAAGIVHRDLKPENVLITPDHRVKVMDLGVARAVDEALRLSQTGAFVGSIHFAAPEQFTDNGSQVDHRADLHALGLLLYELSAGVHPFEADDVRAVMHAVLHVEPRRVSEVNPQLTPFFEEVVHQLLAKDPASRFQSAEQVVAVLEEGEDSAWWKERARTLRAETKKPLRRVRIPRETGIFGRREELDRLRALFEETENGSGQVLFIEGEAGIGKTRLVDEFVGALREEGRDLNFLFGGYPPGGAATAAGAFASAFRDHFGVEGLTGSLELYLKKCPLLAPAFTALLRGDPTPRGEEPLTKDSLHTAFVHALHALAAERPTILLIDDLHFAPEGGRALFAALATAVAGHRVLLVGTSRPGELDGWGSNISRFPWSSLLRLPRLGPKDLTALLVEAFKSRRMAEELGFEIAAKSDGNPFFVFEIIHGLRNRQLIRRREDGSWATDGAIGEIAIPDTLTDLIRARIVALSDEDKDLLEVAACFGFEFDPLIVARAAGYDRTPTLKRLARVEGAHRLVHSTGRRFVFDHHQVQEVLYQRIPELLREDYHLAIAEALEARAATANGDSMDGSLARDLCRHFLASSEPARAARYLEPALDFLRHQYRADEGVRLADRALARPGLVTGRERVHVLLSKATWLDLFARHEEGRAALEEAIAVADEIDDTTLRAKARRKLGWALLSADELESAQAVLTEALELARAAGDRSLQAIAVGNLGSVLSRSGMLREAVDHFRRSLELAEDADAESVRVSALGNLARASNKLGEMGPARDYFERCLELARRLGMRRDEAVATINFGVFLLDIGRLAEALETEQRGLVLCREIGFRRGERVACGNAALCLRGLGRYEDALEFDERSQEIALESGAGALAMHDHLGHGSSLRLLGRLDAARADLTKALDLATHAGIRHVASAVHCELAACDRAAGDEESARSHLEQALELAVNSGNEARIALASARLASLGALEPAAAIAAWEAGRAPLNVIERIEVLYLLWQSTADRAHLDEAARLVQVLCDAVPTEDAEQMLAAVTLYRDVLRAAAGPDTN